MGFQRYIDFELSVSIKVVAEVCDTGFWLFGVNTTFTSSYVQLGRK